MRPIVLVLVLAILLPALSPPVASQDAGGAFRILVRGVTGVFGPETWKEEQPVTGNLSKTSPLPTVPNVVGTYKNPYFDGRPRQLPTGPVNAWGYHVNLTLELADANRQAIQNPPLNLVIDARIEAGTHDIPAKLTKLGPTTFRATFDLDGEAGKNWPAMLGGSLAVAVEVYEQATTASPRKVGQDALTLRSVYGVSSLPAVAFPRDALQLYSDLGNFTAFATAPVAPADTLRVTFSFGVPNATARGMMVSTRAQQVVFDGRTDARGTVTVTAKPSDLLGAAEGGLLLVEAHLVGSPTDLTVGNGLVVVPVQSHATTITSIARETNAGGSDPAAMMRVTVNDPDASPQAGGRHGRVVALDGVRVLANVPYLPADPNQPDLNHKTARFPARFIVEAKVPSYSLFSLLFTERNEFYSLATAQRGYSVSAAPLTLEEGQAGDLRLTVRNLNSNGDPQADIGLASTVRIAITSLPGGGNWSGELSLAEGESRTVEIDVRAVDIRVHEAVVNSTSDELRLDRIARIEVVEPPGAFDSFLRRLPAPAPLALLALAALAAFALRRR